jgi:hypothetical protein
MNKDWFPFFSMLFWCVTKIAGLTLFVVGLYALGAFLINVGGEGGGWFWRLLATVALPLVIGWFLLKTDVLYEMGTEAMRNQQPQPPRGT